ncbi:MAG TPA: isoprenylcysteine carboxylmethyltransferase family protein [Candidatus Omnitrophota bacterium]|nr:isoprenylcysteine carboxylmethyltransferase family protein [Candidatus Omnitrophota bacterium]
MFNLKDREERNNTLKTFIIGGSFIMCLWIGLPYLIHRFIDPQMPSFFKPVRWLGIILNTTGYCLAVWCVMMCIKTGKGTPLPYAGPKKLLVSGPYRFVRNPMVIGTVLFLLGDAALLGSFGIFVYSALIMVIMHIFVLVEEKSLLRRFGTEYSSYFNKTPRWCPRFRSI